MAEEEDAACKEGFLAPETPYEEPPPPYPGDTQYITKNVPPYTQHAPESEPMLGTSTTNTSTNGALLQSSTLREFHPGEYPPGNFHPGEYPPGGVPCIPSAPPPSSSSTTVVMTAPPPLGAVLDERSEAEVNTYMWCSIFTFCCCCPLIGLVAIYLSGEHSSNLSSQNLV